MKHITLELINELEKATNYNLDFDVKSLHPCVLPRLQTVVRFLEEKVDEFLRPQGLVVIEELKERVSDNPFSYAPHPDTPIVSDRIW